MTGRSPSSAGVMREWWALARTHWLASLTLLALSVVAAAGLWLRANLTNPQLASWPLIADSSFPRACSSTGTIFAGATAEQAKQLFQEQVSQTVDERVSLLSSPAKWSCAQSDEPAVQMNELQSLAEALPGWYGKSSGLAGIYSYQLKPVTFASFDSILMEFEREYECRLSELQGPEAKTQAVLQGTDAGAGTQSSANLLPQIPERAAVHVATLDDEKLRARAALERTILTLRSFELQQPLATQLSCLQRELLDTRLEMSMLSSAVECLPRIWDRATSVHDRVPAAKN